MEIAILNLMADKVATERQLPLWFHRHYFPDNDPMKKPANVWLHTAFLYTNWVRAIYEATPYDLADIPLPAAPQPLAA